MTRVRFRRFATIVRVLAAFAVAPLAAAPAAAQAPVPRPGAPESFADLTDRLMPSVVNISTTQTLQRPDATVPIPNLPEGSPLEDFFKDFLERGPNTPRRVNSLGSGFIIDPSGLIVTNNHVIQDADEITVILHDSTELQAMVVGRDDKTDVALLKVEPKAPLQAARFGDSDKARVGEWVIAVGDPFGLGGSVTAGIISARGRDINAGPYDDFIQTDASINRGNSGGPLFNMAGEVIGVNSAIYSPTGGSVGIGFSIPSNMVRNVIGQLRQYGEMRRGWLGVRIQQVTDDIAASLNLQSASGALVAGVTENGPAAKAGIQNGDLIVAFDGKPVPDSRTLPRVVADTPIGKTVNVDVMRGGQRRTLRVSIERLVDEEVADASTPKKGGEGPRTPSSVPQSSVLGMRLSSLTPELRTRYRIGAGVQGVLVTEVDASGLAADKNIRVGDVIVEVAQQKVTSPADVTAKVEAETKAGRGAILLLVNRGGEQTFVGVRLK